MSFGLSAAAVGMIGAGATLAGSAMASRSAGKAADTQAAAAREANELQREQFEQTRGDLAPYRNFGAGSANMLATYLGLPASTMSGGASGGGDPFAGQLLVDSAGGVPQANADLYANNEAYRSAWDEALSNHQKHFGGGYTTDSDGSQIENFLRSKLANTGQQQAQAQAAAEANPNYGYLLRNFTGEDLENEPGYQFGLAEGNKALDRRFASGGNYFSGAALKGATRYAQDYAGTKFGEAFNRDAANKGRIYNFLAGGMSTGQNAAAQTGSAGQAMASNVGQTMTGAANAQGAAQIAQGNAWTSGINNITGMYQQNQLIDKITAGNRGFGYEPWQTTGNGMPR